jgi:hypothetical protein
VEDAKLVASGEPARSTCTPLTNPLPFTVIATAPAGTDAGAMPAGTGTGFWSVTALLPVAVDSPALTARTVNILELGTVAGAVETPEPPHRNAGTKLCLGVGRSTTVRKGKIRIGTSEQEGGRLSGCKWFAVCRRPDRRILPENTLRLEWAGFVNEDTRPIWKVWARASRRQTVPAYVQ